MKRLLVMILSFVTIICLGYSLGALGVTILVAPRWGQVFLWLLLGVISAAIAIALWTSYIKELEANDKLQNRCSETPYE